MVIRKILSLIILILIIIPCSSSNNIESTELSSDEPVKDIPHKPIIKIGKDWSVNGLILGKSNNTDFEKTDLSHSLEKTASTTNGHFINIVYRGGFSSNLYFHFHSKEGVFSNRKDILFEGYFIDDFKYVSISFENGLDPGIPFNEAISLFGESQIEMYEETDTSSYISIVHDIYSIVLYFDENKLFSGIFIVNKNDY
ncbi:MAG TPA: hypothetical protein DIT04_10780 [Dysgonomonas sp.]|nr:hypothetical protein [Dysgonomonas sp.]